MVSNIKPLPKGWTRSIDPINGRFVYERVVPHLLTKGPATLQRRHELPFNGPYRPL